MQVRELSRRLAELGYGVVAWNETVVGREGVKQLERAQQKRKAGGDALWLATQVGGGWFGFRLEFEWLLTSDQP